MVGWLALLLKPGAVKVEGMKRCGLEHGTGSTGGIRMGREPKSKKCAQRPTQPKLTPLAVQIGR